MISYDLLSKKCEELVEASFQMAILDECHFLKNHKSMRLKSAARVVKRCVHLVLLSGTPALSRPIEVYSQVQLLLPNLLRATDYGMRYCDGKKFSLGK